MIFEKQVEPWGEHASGNKLCQTTWTLASKWLKWVGKLWYHPEDRWNERHFHLRFLNLALWTNTAPMLGVNIELDTDGSFVQLNLPYLHFRVSILPGFDPHHRTWRVKR